MSNQLKRGRPYQTTLIYTAADQVQTFVLRDNATGFNLFARSGTAVVRFAADRPTIGGVVSSVAEGQEWAASQLGQAAGRFSTIPVGRDGGWTGIGYDTDITFHVSCNEATTVELTIFY